MGYSYDDFRGDVTKSVGSDGWKLVDAFIQDVKPGGSNSFTKTAAVFDSYAKTIISAYTTGQPNPGVGWLKGNKLKIKSLISQQKVSNFLYRYGDYWGTTYNSECWQVLTAFEKFANLQWDRDKDRYTPEEREKRIIDVMNNLRAEFSNTCRSSCAYVFSFPSNNYTSTLAATAFSFDGAFDSDNGDNDSSDTTDKIDEKKEAKDNVVEFCSDAEYSYLIQEMASFNKDSGVSITIDDNARKMGQLLHLSPAYTRV